VTVEDDGVDGARFRRLNTTKQDLEMSNTRAAAVTGSKLSRRRERHSAVTAAVALPLPIVGGVNLP
jgi:hypothetical protein